MSLAVVRQIQPLGILMMKKIRSNNLSGILESRGLKSVTPNESLLKELGINRNRFGRLLRNEVTITVPEVFAFAKWLGVSETDLIDKTKGSEKKTQ